MGGASLVVDVEECLTGALGDSVDLLVIELVTHNPVRLGVKACKWRMFSILPVMSVSSSSFKIV